MKKLLCTVTLAALLCTAASAASGSYNVSATLRPDIDVQIDGVERTFYHVNGNEIHPISYNDTTYLPLRAIGELMDKNVNWDATTNTATLSGNRVTPDATGTPDTNAKTMAVTFTAEPNYTIVIDGTVRTFRDASGNTTSPMVYNGSIYLPLRAIGEIMGKNVSWNEQTQTVFLTNPSSTGGDVTDFDTSNPTTPGQTTGSVTLEQAKQTALNHAGKTSSEVTFVKGKQDWDDGRKVYEIEFIVKSGSGYTEYDYEIDASTGKIISYDYDAEGYTPSNPGTSTTITEAQAKQIALARVPGATTSNIYEFKLDWDDGRREYEGKIIYQYKEYEFAIDASTGAIIEWDVESIYD